MATINRRAQREKRRRRIRSKLSGTTHLESDGPTRERITVCNSMACSDIELDL